MKLIKVLLRMSFLFGLLFFSVSCKKPETTTNTQAVPATSSESITILNSSFEQPSTANNTFVTTGPPTSWVVYGSVNNSNRAVGVLNPNTTSLYSDAVPQGSNIG